MVQKIIEMFYWNNFPRIPFVQNQRNDRCISKAFVKLSRNYGKDVFKLIIINEKNLKK